VDAVNLRAEMDFSSHPVLVAGRKKLPTMKTHPEAGEILHAQKVLIVEYKSITQHPSPNPMTWHTTQTTQNTDGRSREIHDHLAQIIIIQLVSQTSGRWHSCFSHLCLVREEPALAG